MAYGKAIDALAQGGRWEEALSLLKDMRRVLETEPPPEAYVAALTACRNAGQWQEATALLQEMESPNVECYNIVVDACGREGTVIQLPPPPSKRSTFSLRYKFLFNEPLYLQANWRRRWLWLMK